jgi:hypothetical protein
MASAGKILRHAGKLLRSAGRLARAIACCCGCGCPAGLPSTVTLSFTVTVCNGSGVVTCSGTHIATMAAGPHGDLAGCYYFRGPGFGTDAPCSTTPDGYILRRLVDPIDGVCKWRIVFRGASGNQEEPAPTGTARGAGYRLGASPIGTYSASISPACLGPTGFGGISYTNIVVS